MSLGGGGGSNQSRPMTGEERSDIFSHGLQDILGAASGSPRASAPQTGGWEAIDPENNAGAGWYNTTTGEKSFEAPPAAASAPQFTGGALPTPGQFTFGPAPRTAATYTDPGNAQTLSGGDYNKLEQAILSSRTAPLDRLLSQEREREDADLNKRGLYNSGIAVRAQNDLTERFLPQYTQAGGEAATQRYGAEAAEKAGLNQFALAKAGGANTFNTTDAASANEYQKFLADQAAQKFNTNTNQAWRPYEFLQGLFNQTGGAVASGSNGNASFTI